MVLLDLAIVVRVDHVELQVGHLLQHVADVGLGPLAEGRHAHGDSTGTNRLDLGLGEAHHVEAVTQDLDDLVAHRLDLLALGRHLVLAEAHDELGAALEVQTQVQLARRLVTHILQHALVGGRG